MKIGYKGFDKELKCRGEQFEVGQTCYKPLGVGKIRPILCTSDGWHYCDRIQDVDRFYSFSPKLQNRFCEIEVLGPYSSSGDKSITNHFRIIRELSSSDIDEIVLDEKMNLSTVRQIQTEYPMFYVGGSVGLYLHGVRLERWKKTSYKGDIDFCSPYFVLPQNSETLDIHYVDAKNSGNDFDETFVVNGNIKVDYKIDPKQRYEIIEYKGFKYKVSPLMIILEAKMRYAMVGGSKSASKHKDDIEKMIISKK